MRKLFLKKGFTLAEVMVVLTVIGILTAILLPTAFHATPDENMMKFKKANGLLYQIVREIASTGKYYKEGDMRFKPEGDNVAVPNNYMCQVFADMLSTKTVKCGNNAKTPATVYHVPSSVTCAGTTCDGADAAKCCNVANAKAKLDAICNFTPTYSIVTADDVIWYEANQTTVLQDPTCTNAPDCNSAYKVFCLKIDTLYAGYGIRSDGKILAGKNADTYTKASITQE